MNSHAISEINSEAPATTFLHRTVRAVLWLHVLIIVVCISQQFFGLGWNTEHRIRTEDIRKIDDLYRWRLPEDYRGWLMNRRAILLANGEPFLNRSLSNRDLAALRDGWFHVRDSYVRFVPQDGSDPRRNGVRYTVTTPEQFEPELWWALSLTLLALVFANNALRCRRGQCRSSPPVDPPPPTARQLLIESAIVCALTLIALTLHLHLGGELTDHAFAIKDVPESDAAAWYHMAEDLAEGQGLRGGFEAQRPFYIVLLGGAFSLFDVSLSVAKAFNAICLALATTGLWLLGRMFGSRAIALLMVLLTLLGGLHLDYVHGILTENAGLPFAVIALLSVWTAAQTRSRRGAFVAGMVNGVGNLASGVALFTLPFYALWLAVESLRRSGWRAALFMTFLYTAGATFVIGPWLVRQAVVHDHLTLSYNTAEVLAGGADLERGKLSAEAFEEARAAGIDLTDIDARYDYFMERFKQAVAAHPKEWLAQVLKAAEYSLRWMPNSEPGFRLVALLSLLVFSLVAAIRQGRWIALPIATALIVFWARAGFAISLPLLLVAAVLLMVVPARTQLRSLTLLTLGTCLCCMLLSGLSGNVAAKRFWIVADWSGTLIIVAACWHLIDTGSRMIHDRLQRLMGPSWFAGPPSVNLIPRDPAAKIPAILCLSGLLIGLSSVSMIAVAVETLKGPRPPFSGLVQPDSSDLLHQLSDQLPPDWGVPSLVHPEIKVHLARLDDLHLSLAAGEGTQHWLPQYEKKPYPHWVAQPSILTDNGQRTGGIAACGTGSLDGIPRAWPLLFVGVATYPRDHLGGAPSYVLQTLCVIPLAPSDSGSWQPDESQIRWFAPSPEAVTALRPPAAP